MISLSGAPDTTTAVLAVVATASGWPLAVFMTRLLPFTRSSVPAACAIRGHPVTAVRAVPVPGPDLTWVTWVSFGGWSALTWDDVRA